MKYVMFKQGAWEFPVIFPEFVEHKQIAVADNFLQQAAVPVAAGFVDASGQARGKSTGLKLASRPEDTGIIRFLTETGCGL